MENIKTFNKRALRAVLRGCVCVTSRTRLSNSVLLHDLGHTGCVTGPTRYISTSPYASIFAKSMCGQNKIDGSDARGKNRSMSVT